MRMIASRFLLIFFLHHAAYVTKAEIHDDFEAGRNEAAAAAACGDLATEEDCLMNGSSCHWCSVDGHVGLCLSSEGDGGVQDALALPGVKCSSLPANNGETSTTVHRDLAQLIPKGPYKLGGAVKIQSCSGGSGTLSTCCITPGDFSNTETCGDPREGFCAAGELSCPNTFSPLVCENPAGCVMRCGITCAVVRTAASQSRPIRTSVNISGGSGTRGGATGVSSSMPPPMNAQGSASAVTGQAPPMSQQTPNYPPLPRGNSAVTINNQSPPAAAGTPASTSQQQTTTSTRPLPRAGGGGGSVTIVRAGQPRPASATAGAAANTPAWYGGGAARGMGGDSSDD